MLTADIFLLLSSCFVCNSHIYTLHPSLACLAAAGRHADCLKLLNDWMACEGPTSDLYILRARLHKNLNKVTAATLQIPGAAADEAAAVENNLLQGTDGETSALVNDCKCR